MATAFTTSTDEVLGDEARLDPDDDIHMAKRREDLLFISQGIHKLILAHGAQHLYFIAVGGHVKVGGHLLTLEQTFVDGCSVIRLSRKLFVEEEP